MVLAKLSVLGRPTNFDYNRENFDYNSERACYTCSKCGRRLFWTFFSHLLFLSSISFSLIDGPI